MVAYPTDGTPQDFQDFMKGFLDYFTEIIVDRIKEVIRTQEFKSKWHKLSPKYLEFKKRWGLEMGIWISGGHVVDSIAYWWSPLVDGYIIGVPPALKHRVPKRGGGYDKSKKQKVRVMQILKWMENGTRKMPARPLFTPVMKYYQKKSVQQKIYQDYLKKVKGVS